MAVAMTVTGPVEGDALGVTLPHEHVLLSMAYAFPATSAEATEPITIDKLGALRNDMMINVNTIILDESCDPEAELAKARDVGVQTIVDLTPPELSRDPVGLARISEATGLNIICGTGHYLRLQQRPEVQQFIDESSPDAIAAEMVGELMEGIGDTGIRAGVIGEIGLFSPVHPGELKTLEAAVLAHRETGAPLFVHLMEVSIVDDALEVFDRVEPLWDRVIFCHMDFDIRDLSRHRRALERGINVEFDFFGSTWWPHEWYLHFPTDPQRLVALSELAGEGFASQLLVSHDVCTRVQLTQYGGFGYGYLRSVVPGMMEALELDAGLLDQFMIENPRRLLTWADE
jgi:phosphotriesterase-related protein